MVKSSIQCQKIVMPHHMQEYEGYFIAKDPSMSEKFMDQASMNMSIIIIEKILKNDSEKEVFILAGKGNNGADALTIGSILLTKGYNVTAFILFPKVSELSQKKALDFSKNSGKTINVVGIEDVIFSKGSLIIDGMLGTGFSGDVDGIIKEVIEKCNSLDNEVFSIDIPSGLNGVTGLKAPVCVRANHTCSLGAFKMGHFFHDGMDNVGNLCNRDFGLRLDCLYNDYECIDFDGIKGNLITQDKKSHKYQVGQACMIAGSKSMIGAANLATLACFKAGIGIVKNFTIDDCGPCPINEVIREKGTIKKIEKELLRSKSLLIGPGIGRSKETKKLVETFLQEEEVPLVIDGDGLFFVNNPPLNAILTPHVGELCKLLKVKSISFPDNSEIVQNYCNHHGVFILAKGVPNVLFSPFDKKIVMKCGNVGMATAGSGDVLSGIIAALLAANYHAKEATILACLIHGKAGDFAAMSLGIRSMMASDIINHIPKVLKELQ